MRDYAKVAPGFWTGETGRYLRTQGPQTQVVAFYLVTCPSANMLGLYYLALPTLCHESGCPLEGALKALRSLSKGGFARYDRISEHVFVPNMAREQIGPHLSRKDNRHVAVRRELEQLRKSPFFPEFMAIYRVPYELHDLDFPKPLGSPFEGPSKPLRSQEQEQEQKQEQKQEQEGMQGDRAARSPAALLPVDFALTDGRRALAGSQRLDPERTFKKFTNYYRAVAGPKSRSHDWDAVWETWCLNENDHAHGNGSRKPPRRAKSAEELEALERSRATR